MILSPAFPGHYFLRTQALVGLSLLLTSILGTWNPISKRGAFSKYQLLWVLLASTLIGLLFQVLAVRLGAVTGRDLAETCRLNFSSAESKILWLMTQIAIIGSDIQEIVGSAVAFRVLFGLPLWAGCLLTGLDTLSFLMIHYLGVRKLEAFFGTLIFTMCCCFFATFFYGDQDWRYYLRHFRANCI